MMLLPKFFNLQV